MRLHRVDDVRQFYPIVESFLISHEAENCLLIGTLSVLANAPERGREIYLSYVEDSGVVCGAAMRTPPYGLVISRVDDLAAVDLIAEDVMDRYGDTVPAVNSVKAVAHRFAERYGGLTGLTAEIDVAERIYRLDQVNPVRPAAGGLVRVEESDRELLRAWYHGFLTEAFAKDSADDAEVDRQLNLRLNADPSVRGLHLWMDNGVAVTMVGYTGPTPNGIRIGPVYTPHEYRKRGYATAATAALSQMLLDQGRRCCFLFTDLANPTSNHIYKEIGYYEVCDVDQLEFVRLPSAEAQS